MILYDKRYFVMLYLTVIAVHIINYRLLSTHLPQLNLDLGQYGPEQSWTRFDFFKYLL